MEGKLTEEDKRVIQEKLDELKKEISGKNADEVKKKRDDLENAWMPIMKKIYQEQADSGNTAGPQPQEDKDETIEDADFEEAK